MEYERTLYPPIEPYETGMLEVGGSGVLPRVGDNWTMRWIEGADHSFHVLKSSGRTDAEVMKDMGYTTSAWTTTVSAR